MTKHIHIYLHSKTKDTGNFKEEEHKRDSGGQFSSTSGAGVKTTAEYAAHESVQGLTGAAKKAAIKLLYDADKASAPKATKQKLPTNKELDKLAKDYANSYHKVNVIKETDKAVGVPVHVDYADAEKSVQDLVWVPKSALRDGHAPGWLLNKRLDEITEKHRGLKRGSVVASLG